MDSTDSSTVIEIGDFRIARKKRYPGSGAEITCKHKRMTIDALGDVITCDDCGKHLGAMWVLNEMLRDYNRAFEKLDARARALQELTTRGVHLIAARKVEAAWRRRDTVPACPHCSRGILASDQLGAMQISKRLELLRRERDRAKRLAESTTTSPLGSSS